MAARPYITGRSPTSLAEGKHRWSRPLDPRTSSLRFFKSLKIAYRFGENPYFCAIVRAKARLWHAYSINAPQGAHHMAEGHTSLGEAQHHLPKANITGPGSCGAENFSTCPLIHKLWILIHTGPVFCRWFPTISPLPDGRKWGIIEISAEVCGLALCNRPP